MGFIVKPKKKTIRQAKGLGGQQIGHLRMHRNSGGAKVIHLVDKKRIRHQKPSPEFGDRSLRSPQPTHVRLRIPHLAVHHATSSKEAPTEQGVPTSFEQSVAYAQISLQGVHLKKLTALLS